MPQTKADVLEQQDRPNYLRSSKKLRIQICKYRKCGRKFETYLEGLEYCMPAHREWANGVFPDCYDDMGNFRGYNNA